MQQLTPAEYVIHVFGGVRATALAIGRNASSVCKWTKSKAKHGLDGKIPSSLQKTVLEVAKKRKLDIKAQDLIYGRRVLVKNKRVKIE